MLPPQQRLLANHPTYFLLGFSAALAPKFPPSSRLSIRSRALGLESWLCYWVLCCAQSHAKSESKKSTSSSILACQQRWPKWFLLRRRRTRVKAASLKTLEVSSGLLILRFPGASWGLPSLPGASWSLPEPPGAPFGPENAGSLERFAYFEGFQELGEPKTPLALDFGSRF